MSFHIRKAIDGGITAGNIALFDNFAEKRRNLITYYICEAEGWGL